MSSEIPVRLTVVEDSVALRPDVVAAETVSERFSVCPVPVSDEFHIRLTAGEQDRVGALIHDRADRVLYASEGSVTDFAGRTITADEAGFTTGFYCLRVEYSNGKRDLREFIKEIAFLCYKPGKGLVEIRSLRFLCVLNIDMAYVFAPCSDILFTSDIARSHHLCAICMHL